MKICDNHAARDELLDIIQQSSGPVSIRALLTALRSSTGNQIVSALVDLEETEQIEMIGSGRHAGKYKATGRRVVGNGSPAYTAQRTRPGGVLTREGFIPYLRHPSGWDLPALMDADGYPIRRCGQLVYACPDGSEYTAEGGP